MSDLLLTPEGDILLDRYAQDAQSVSGLDEMLQHISYVVKTRRGDVPSEPNLGSNLHLLVGELLTIDSLRDGENYIRDAIFSWGEKFLTLDVTVRGIPITATEALFVIEIRHPLTRGSRIFTIPFDFQHGIVTVRANNAAGTATLSEWS